MRRASDESLTNVGNEWTMSVRMESRNVAIYEDEPMKRYRIQGIVCSCGNSRSLQLLNPYVFDIGLLHEGWIKLPFRFIDISHQYNL